MLFGEVADQRFERWTIGFDTIGVGVAAEDIVEF